MNSLSEKIQDGCLLWAVDGQKRTVLCMALPDAYMWLLSVTQLLLGQPFRVPRIVPKLRIPDSWHSLRVSNLQIVTISNPIEQIQSPQFLLTSDLNSQRWEETLTTEEVGKGSHYGKEYGREVMETIYNSITCKSFQTLVQKT